MAARLIALLCCSLPAVAADGNGTPADRQDRLERAAILKAEAATRKQQADALLERRHKECAEKFLVNACREEASADHLATIRDVRRLEGESQALERQANREEAEERERARQADARQREAELAAREAEVAAARQAAETAAAERRADKERQAAEGARRKAAEAERQRQKRADHEARVAKKKQQAAEKQ